MPSTLLATKLHRPPPTSNLLDRPRLIRLLDDGLKCGHRLFLVAAPAGYGKTTLVADWLSRCSVPSAWLSLDAADNEPLRFFRYVSAALEKALGSGLTQPVPDPFPLVPRQTEELVRPLINDLAALDQPVLLVLDDYHVITGAQVQEAAVYLLEHAPAALHLVVLTRADPPFPLSRLRVRGQMTEIRDRDLRFTPDEMPAFLNTLHHLNLSEGHVAALESRTEGWAAGVHLAALSLQGLSADRAAAFIDAFSGSHHYVADYLFDEVLSRQPPVVSDLLIRTSVLDRLCAPLCDAVMGWRSPSPDASAGDIGLAGTVVLPGNNPPSPFADAGKILEHLERSNLFLIPLDDGRQWYRYHHLFTDFLTQACKSSRSPEEIAGLHARASEWHRRNGSPADAYHHALLAGRHECAAEIVEENAWSMVRRAELGTLKTWIQSLPASALSARPWLRICHAWALFLEGSDAAEAQLDAVDRLLQAGGQPSSAEMQGHVAAIRAWIAYVRGDLGRAITLARKALELCPRIDDPVRSGLLMFWGMGRFMQNDWEEAARAFADGAELARASGNVMLEVLSRASLGALSEAMGRLQEAEAVYQAALQTAVRNNSPVAGQPCACLARVYRQWNDLASARLYAERFIEFGALWGVVDSQACGNLFLAVLFQGQHEIASAERALAQANEIMQEHPHELASRFWLGATRAVLSLTRGRLDDARAWAETRGLGVEGSFDLQTEVEYIALVRILLAEHRAEEALRLLSRLQDAMESTGRQGDLVQVLVLRTSALIMQTETASAMATLHQALRAAQPGGYMRVFLDEGKPMETLLRSAVTSMRWKDSQVLAHAGALLASFDREPGAITAIPAGHAGILSQREIELLRLVAAGRSNNEIAAELVIALGTVKRHTANIFDKLDVRSRTEAVAKARLLGLL